MTIEKAGQRVIWIISSATCAVGLLLLALNEKFHWTTVLPVICIFIYNFGYGLGIGPIPWFIVSELFDVDTRASANSFCILCNWAFAFIMVMVFPEMKDSMGMFGVSLFFFAVCIFSILFGIFMIPNPSKIDETPNKDQNDQMDSQY